MKSYASFLSLAAAAIFLVGLIGSAHASSLSFSATTTIGQPIGLSVGPVTASANYVYEGSNITLTDPGAYNGNPAYTTIAWYEVRPGNSTPSTVSFNSPTVKTVEVAYVFTPEPTRDPPGTYIFYLQVTDAKGDVSQSRSIGIPVLKEPAWLSTPPVGQIIRANNYLQNTTVKFTLTNQYSFELAYNNSPTRYVVYTNLTGKYNINFSANTLQVSRLAGIPSGYFGLSSEDLYSGKSTQTNFFVNASMAYPCDIPSSSVYPFIFINGGWSEIVTPFYANASSCRINFVVPMGYIVLVASHGNYATTTTSTVNTTTVFQQVTNRSANSISQNGIKNQTLSESGGSSGPDYGLYIGIVALIIAGILVVVLLKERAEHDREYEMMMKSRQEGQKKDGPA
jgi:hypothetical protein